jgi:hypothetical protein
MVKRGRSEFVAYAVCCSSVHYRGCNQIIALAQTKAGVHQPRGLWPSPPGAAGIKGTPWTFPLRMPLIPEAGGLLVVVADPTIPAELRDPSSSGRGHCSM